MATRQQRQTRYSIYKGLFILALIIGTLAWIAPLFASLFKYSFSPLLAMSFYIGGPLLTGIAIIWAALYKPLQHHRWPNQNWSGAAGYDADKIGYKYYHLPSGYKLLAGLFILLGVVMMLASPIVPLLPEGILTSIGGNGLVQLLPALLAGGALVVIFTLAAHLLHIEKNLWAKRAKLAEPYKTLTTITFILGLLLIVASLIVWSIRSVRSAGQPLNLAQMGIVVGAAVLTVISASWQLANMAINAFPNFKEKYQKLGWGFKLLAAFFIALGVASVAIFPILPLLPAEALTYRVPSFLLANQPWLLGIGIPLIIGTIALHFWHIKYEPKPKPARPIAEPTEAAALLNRDRLNSGGLGNHQSFARMQDDSWRLDGWEQPVAGFGQNPRGQDGAARGSLQAGSDPYQPPSYQPRQPFAAERKRQPSRLDAENTPQLGYHQPRSAVAMPAATAPAKAAIAVPTAGSTVPARPADKGQKGQSAAATASPSKPPQTTPAAATAGSSSAVQPAVKKDKSAGLATFFTTPAEAAVAVTSAGSTVLAQPAAIAKPKPKPAAAIAAASQTSTAAATAGSSGSNQSAATNKPADPVACSAASATAAVVISAQPPAAAKPGDAGVEIQERLETFDDLLSPGGPSLNAVARALVTVSDSAQSAGFTAPAEEEPDAVPMESASAGSMGASLEGLPPPPAYQSDDPYIPQAASASGAGPKNVSQVAFFGLGAGSQAIGLQAGARASAASPVSPSQQSPTARSAFRRISPPLETQNASPSSRSRETIAAASNDSTALPVSAPNSLAVVGCEARVFGAVSNASAAATLRSASAAEAEGTSSERNVKL